VNRLQLPSGKTQGIICRYIRICPLAQGEGGFHGAKSMRVGVYGHTPFGAAKQEDDLKNKKSDRCNVESKGRGDLIRDKSVPAAIITIRQPSTDLKRGCWAVPHRAEGVYASRHGNRGETWGWTAGRQKRKNLFRQKAKTLRRVSDYGWDHDPIHNW